ncbi:MAG TPA: PHP domain-containing protein [Candidatus Angelobacter sp.]|jgi:predicted metal-dependent phosphoesterase TrpH|nr:PHP domain-containing protein [Candidatus Angelobacter sp.]
MSSRVDLHMHTVASDGDLTPEELVARCAEQGLSSIAVTDHNSTVSVQRAAAACDERGLDLIQACEISTRWNDREHHLLAYFVPLDDPVFAARIERVRAADLERTRRWVANAGREGFALRWEDVEALVGADRVPPFALLGRALVETAGDDPRMAPYRESRGRLYGDWFSSGKPLSTEAPYQPELPEAISWVREAGGVPVLAHPGATLGSLDPAAAFAELFGEGLGGVEAWTTWHKPEQSERFEALAHAAGLTVTAGADFHGPTVKPFVANPGQVTHNGPEVLDGLVRARETGGARPVRPGKL